MAYADLKIDVVFRKVFGEHPDVLTGLLNDLLDRQGDEAITSIEYLPPDQAPLVMGMKLSILDVRCKDASGATFVVEMQVLPVTGFLNRVVYNACKAYVGTLKKGRAWHELTEVIAVSICDFELWSDADQRTHGETTVPLVSRWSMSEHTNGSRRAMGQVQFVFLELPKLGDRVPGTAVERWAALFRSAPDLTPEGMANVPLSDAQRHALEHAREESMTARERDLIERSAEEVDQVRRIAEDARVQAWLAMVFHQFSRKLQRPLTDDERHTLTVRLRALGVERLSDIAQELDAAALAVWLAARDAT